MVPDSAAACDVGSNGLPKNHPQESNKYLFSIDVKHESNHPEMGLNSSAVVLEASLAPSSSPTPEGIDTALSLSRRKNKVRSNLVISRLPVMMFISLVFAASVTHYTVS